jgi:hypothetical protein
VTVVANPRMLSGKNRQATAAQGSCLVVRLKLRLEANVGTTVKLVKTLHQYKPVQIEITGQPVSATDRLPDDARTILDTAHRQPTNLAKAGRS